MLMVGLLAMFVAHVSRRIETWVLANDDLSEWARTQWMDASLILLCVSASTVAIAVVR